MKNCWTKVEILPNYNDDENGINIDDCEDHANIQLELQHLKDLEEV